MNFEGPLAISLWREIRASYGPVLSLPARSAAGAALATLIRRSGRGEFRDAMDESEAAYAFAMLCWREQIRRAAGDDPVWSDMMDRLSARYREPVTVKELADEAGVSREYFTRRFTALSGQSPAAFLRACRLRAARDQLQRTDLPVAEIARACGFTSGRQLAVAFRRNFGHPPGEGRRG